MSEILDAYSDQFHYELFVALDSTNNYNASICWAGFNPITFKYAVQEKFKGMAIVDPQQIKQFVAELFERNKTICGVDVLLTLIVKDKPTWTLQISPPNNEFPPTLSTATHPHPRNEYLNIDGLGWTVIFKNPEVTIRDLVSKIMHSSEFVNMINYLYHIFINSIRLKKSNTLLMKTTGCISLENAYLVTILIKICIHFVLFLPPQN